MKTYLKDYSMDSGMLVSGGDELEEIITNRQSKFELTAEYQKTKNKIMEALKKIETLIPEEEHRTITELDETIVYLECLSYSAAYRDGMSDLMTAMTFNKLQITNCKYIDFSDEEELA
jgi:hypothetical protein